MRFDRVVPICYQIVFVTIFIGFFMPLPGYGQVVCPLSGAEYFFDIDPGEGNGTPILQPADGAFDSPEEEVDLSDVSASSLSKGIHRLFVRFRDCNGWGTARFVTFTGWGIAAAEYYIDTDPGTGQGIPLPAKDGTFDSGMELVDKSGIPTTGLAPGLHKLYVRFQDDWGRWSAPTMAEFRLVSQFKLTVRKTGTGSGTVSSSPVGITCGTDCSHDYLSGTTVTLNPERDSRSKFDGWHVDSSPDCSDGIVTMNMNKTCIATFTAIELPDFVITGVTLYPAVPAIGGLFNLTVTVKNQGRIASDGGQLALWVNQPTIQNCNATPDKSVSVGSVAAGATKTLRIAGLSVSTGGHKTLRAFVDSTCVIPEIDETNNQYPKTYEVGAPDFVVTNITLSPNRPATNGTFSATVTIKNQGTLAGDAGFLDIWTDEPTAQACFAFGDWFVPVGRLEVGEIKMLTFPGLSAGSAGTKTFRAFIDSWCGTKELNEGNNQRILPYTVTNQPDFVVTGISLTPASPAANSTFTAKVTVKNQGTAAGDARNLTVWANRTTTPACGASGALSQPAGIVAVGESKMLTFPGLVAGSVGTKTFLAFVDSACATPESREDNNQLRKGYTVR